ncbi:hypothetical protein E2C01_042088 [Portunus trituberculatus]|uniref:Uncharacterized protein n=1 Tax=Portunus trituberculatus TaxID=210409 RepID=A0A5B7FKV5_PORTR|nr:hypothetical protein [Portunus trituberculatus]
MDCGSDTEYLIVVYLSGRHEALQRSQLGFYLLLPVLCLLQLLGSHTGHSTSHCCRWTVGNMSILAKV